MKIRLLEVQKDIRSRDVGRRMRECRDLSRELSQTRRFYVKNVDRDADPWTLHDRIEIVFLLVLSLVAIGIGIFNSANLLHSSGQAMFSTWFQALPFCLTLLVGAMGLKSIARLFPPGPCQRRYGRAIFGIGLTSFLLWMGCFGITFRGVFTPVSERIAQLGSLDPHSVADIPLATYASTFIMLLSGLADAFLCGGAWVVCHLIVHSHRIGHAVEMPEWETKRKSLDRALRHLDQQRDLLAFVCGALTTEYAEQAKFINRAVALYKGEAASWRQMRGLLE
jgi:hypothetical protein